MTNSWLANPLTYGLDPDDPRMPSIRRQVILGNGFLHRVYLEWYQHLKNSILDVDGAMVELGSAGGFLPDVIPDLYTTDIFFYPETKITLDGQFLPFADGSLKAIFMTNVMHHIQDNRLFFSEAARCIRKKGCIAMIEPWCTPWSTLIYNVLHHEPFDPTASDWKLESHGPLKTANDALPWIIFGRDREKFDTEFPEWSVKEIKLIMPFRYLVSGGISLRQLMPVWSFPFWTYLEMILSPVDNLLSMFAFIKLERQ
jgi:SAM-dependent methyltransferase